MEGLEKRSLYSFAKRWSSYSQDWGQRLSVLCLDYIAASIDMRQSGTNSPHGPPFRKSLGVTERNDRVRFILTSRPEKTKSAERMLQLRGAMMESVWTGGVLWWNKLRRSLTNKLSISQEMFHPEERRVSPLFGRASQRLSEKSVLVWPDF